jgi:hypothetical protein
MTEDWVKESVPKGATVYYMTDHTDAGAYIRLFVVARGEIEEITTATAKITKMTHKPGRGLYRKGYGYNHGADCVEELSYNLYKNVAELKKKQL